MASSPLSPGLYWVRGIANDMRLTVDEGEWTVVRYDAAGCTWQIGRDMQVGDPQRPFPVGRFGPPAIAPSYRSVGAEVFDRIVARMRVRDALIESFGHDPVRDDETLDRIIAAVLNNGGDAAVSDGQAGNDVIDSLNVAVDDPDTGWLCVYGYTESGEQVAEEVEQTAGDGEVREAQQRVAAEIRRRNAARARGDSP